MDDFKIHLKNMNNDIKNGNAIFFVGAGISVNSGVPIVSQIYKELAKTLAINLSELMFLIGDKPFERTMDFLLMNDAMEGHIKKLFNQILPTATHYYLANQIHNGNIGFVITTNFDQLIEIAYAKIANKNLEKVVPNIFENFNPSPSTKALLKLHGCVTENLHDLGITIHAVANETNQKNIQNILEKLIPPGETRSLIIMGYSGSDIFDINPALNRILTPNKFIYRISHADKGIFSVKPLSQPYEDFKGIELVCNTDELIENIWNETISSPYVENPISIEKNEWRTAFLDWKKEVTPFKGLKECEILQAFAESWPTHLDASIKYGRKALDILKNNNDLDRPDWTALIRNQLAQRLRTKFEETRESVLLDEALLLTEQALHFYESHPSWKEILLNYKPLPDYFAMANQYCWALGGHALVLRSMGKLKDAIKIHESIIEICERSGNKKILAISLGNLGFIWTYFDLNKGIEFGGSKKCLSLGHPIRTKG